MRELLTMEETLRKCSLQLPVEPDFFQRPADCKGNKDCAILSPTQRNAEQSNEVVLRSQEELKGNPFHNTGTESEKCFPLPVEGFNSAPLNYLSCSIGRSLDETEQSDLELKCENFTSDLHLSCYQDAKSCVSKVIDTKEQNLLNLNNKQCEKIDGNCHVTCTSENNCDHESVNEEVSKISLSVAIDKTEYTNEEQAESIKKHQEENECNPNLENTGCMKEELGEDANEFLERNEFCSTIEETEYTNERKKLHDGNELNCTLAKMGCTNGEQHCVNELHEGRKYRFPTEETECTNKEGESVNKSHEGNEFIPVLGETGCANREPEYVNKLNEGNEFSHNCEEKLEATDNSSGYLSQYISNSVTEGVQEHCADINENCLKSSTEPSVEAGNESPRGKSHRSELQEAERTQNHINYLLQSLPELAKYFEIHKKIGVGTFSSVFLASLKEDVAHRFPKLKARKFAIKHLVPTLLPRRIARELKYLNQIGGKDNVVGVDFSVRNEDCVVFIMPYLAHKRFSEYVLDMDAREARDYMRNLMIALKRVHSFNVIHRDIKPSNFLYNRSSKRYLLVDFGLSQNVHPQARRTIEERVRKRKRPEENCSENFRKVTQISYNTSVTDLKPKRMVFQSRGKEGNVIQAVNGISQPVKRFKLSDPYARGQKMIDHLNQQKNTSDNKRTPLTPKMANHQKTTVSQSFKLPYSSPKVVDKDMNIKKKLFPANNENEQPRLQESNIRIESPVQSNLSSTFGLGKSTHQNVLLHKSSFMSSSCTEHGATSLVSSVENQSSKQKFQTLVPKPSKDGNKTGSTVVRVQNSQVKSQMLKPLSPLESEQQRKLLFSKQRNKKLSQTMKQECFCKGLPQVCGNCVKQRSIPAPRAGTPGFRPPEVLLKYSMQTTAVDMWAAGVIMLCILSGCYPFFRSPDDITGLAEMMTIFGTESIKQVAKSLGRSVQCSNHKPPLDLRKLCERLRRRRKERTNGVPDTTNALPICPLCDNSIETERDGCLCLGSDRASSSGEFPPSAYDLLQKLLDLNPISRISAEEALQHPFLKSE